MGKLIKGIHHVALKCMGQEEFDRTISFYKNVLGLEVLRTWGEGKGAGVMFSTGSGVIEIFANGDLWLQILFLPPALISITFFASCIRRHGTRKRALFT